MASLSLPLPRQTAPSKAPSSSSAVPVRNHESSSSGEDDDEENYERSPARHNPQPQSEEEPGTTGGRRAGSSASQRSSRSSTSAVASVKTAPSYEERCQSASLASSLSPEERKRRNIPPLFVPRRLTDFDDGGAFPEIPVAQYPRHMGNPHLKKTTAGSGSTTSNSQAIVNVQIDKDGEVSYDAIVKGGTNSDKIVYTKLDDVRGGPPDPDEVALPTPDEEAAEMVRTQNALQALLAQKTKLDKPSGSALAHVDASRNLVEKTQFIQYTPNPNAPGYNPAASQRVIQMVPAQIDPMMPPKHKHLKAPRGPAEDPVPVLHGPPPKLTKEEKAQWNIPACISNWKNSRGFTIPLDKRLAADGRGLRDHTIGDKFATLSESLYVAEKHARQEVRLRAQVQSRLALQEKEQREVELRELAQRARMERGGIGGGLGPPPAGGVHVGGSGDGGALAALQQEGYDSDDSDREGEHANDGDGGGGHGAPSGSGAESEDVVAARQRERLRMERKRERERDLRMDKNVELKKRRLEEERDVSEKIALGAHTGPGGLDGDNGVDSRLYSQTGGLDSGFGAEDEYNVYSKPLFDRTAGGAAASSSSIYRPTRGETEHTADEQYQRLQAGATSRFQPDQGFAGAEGGKATGSGSRGGGAGPRNAPVQFEKEGSQPKK